ncbi:MAG: hypothetical protein A3F42_01565 [Gammaproteobacteria bacterium RIFCSPHIGHO2_12_FULL_37_34]|nr:MAG: hypothetical protein A3F42_01565 [Gammaproteobacteria bacterium RIFCSPHIGHO2_12_FULL_37_34]
MKIQHGMLVAAIFLIATPAVSMADITVDNYSNSYATGHAKHSCSATAGSRGILQPNQRDFTVPQTVIDSFCFISNCIVHVYASQNCTGSEIAVVEVDRKKGIININNLDPAHYQFVGGGKHVEVHPVHQAYTFKPYPM